MNPKIARSVLALALIAGAGLVLTVAGAGAAGRSASGDGHGSEIAFSRFCQLRNCPSTVEHQQTEIWVMDADGGNPERLTHNTTWDLGPVWSPDGQTVAFFGVQYNPSTDASVGPAHVYLIKADGTDQRLLTPNQPGRWPSYSPDGTKIAFDATGPNSGGDIFVVDSDGSGSPQNLTHDPTERNIRPDWSPDGQKIAFVRNGEIYVMNADGSDGGNPTCLTCSTDLENGTLGTDNAPAWSPDGHEIAFQKTVFSSSAGHIDGHLEIYVMNADGSNPIALTSHDPNTNPGDSDDPSWSPNGQQITFERDLQATGAPEVFIMNADGSNVTQLTKLPFLNGHPGWSRGPVLTP